MTKEELTKKLGAKRFQKLVYKVENIKFYLLKNQLSFLIPLIEKQLKKSKNKAINNTNDPIKQDIIEEKYKKELILFRKELNLGKNRNYHFDMDYSKNFKEYLLWNRSVHIKGIIKNIIVLLASIPIFILTSGIIQDITIIITIINALSFIINFECVNLQNYHLIRYTRIEEKLEQRKNTEILEKNKKYSNAINAINTQIKKSNELPKLNIYEMKREELEELRKLLLEVQQNNKKLERKRQ